MEFAASALTSMASAATSVGSAVGATDVAGSVASGLTSAAGAATSIGSFLPSGSMVAGILSGGASLLQMSNLKRAGQEKALSYDLAAQEVPTEIGQENLKAQSRQTNLKKALLDTIGQRDAAYAASGVDLTFGTPAVAREQAVDDANTAIATDSAASDYRVARLNEKAANLRYAARSARRSADEQADVAGIEAVGKLFRRG